MNIEALLRLLANNEEIDGVALSENTEYGWGEHATYCRRMLEEFVDLCIEAPEGVDIEADAYFETIDWAEVAEKIVENLG